MIDVDHFKSYNDLYGHMAGDTCLRAIADVINAHASRAGDVAARFGGEEFSVLMSDTGETEAVNVAEAVLAGIQALDLPHAGSSRGRVTISAGVAVRQAASAQTAPQFVEAADQALYRAKRSGRCRVCLDQGAPMAAEDHVDGEIAG